MPLTKLTLEKLREAREVIVSLNIGEFDKPQSYFDQLKKIDDEIETRTTKTCPKYSIGDKVKYLPKLSGLNVNTPFEISALRWEDKEPLFADPNFRPMWVYSFKGMNLGAIETDLKLIERKPKLKTIQIIYWHSKFADVPFEHQQVLSYSIKERNSIIDLLVDRGYSVMLKTYEHNLTIFIDNGRFGQR